MSYNAIAEAAQDRDLRARVTACVAADNIGAGSPESWVTTNMLTIATHFESAWAHSMTAQPYHSRRGHDPAIITDAAIKTAVQAVHEGGRP